MADDLVLNKIEGASLDVTAQQTRFLQTGSINNMNTSGLDPVELLWRAATILRNNGFTITSPQTLLAGHPGVTLQRIQVTGYTTDGVNIVLFWETPSFGVTTIYTVRKSTRLTPYQTDLMPGTRIPIRIAKATVPGKDENGNDQSFVVEGDNVLFTFLKPLEEIQIFALYYGSPPYVGNRVGCVNDAPWPQTGYSLPTFGGHNPNNERKDIGYWLLTEWTTTESRYSGYYELTGAAVSRVDEDWSYTGCLIDRATGKKVELADPAGTAAAMMQPPYTNTIIYNNKGMIRVGPYKLTSFSSLFGF